MENSFQKLISIDANVEDQYVIIFELKSKATLEAITDLIEAYNVLSQRQQKSCLILHEIAYAFGQLPTVFKEKLDPLLISIIKNEQEFDIVRHEAAEALANVSPNEHQELYEYYAVNKINDNQDILADTCKLSLQKGKTYNELHGLYGQAYNSTREPAPPFSEQEIIDNFQILDFTTLPIEEQTKKVIGWILSDETQIFNKYRLLYFIRNKKHTHQIIEMAKLLINKQLHALIKHEIGFILGQLGTDCPKDILPILVEICSDVTCPAIARHEVLSAFQTILSDSKEAKLFLQKFVDDNDQIVRETARVSLKVSDFWC